MSKNRLKTLLAAMGLTAALLPLVSATALNRAKATESNNLRRYCRSFRPISPTGFTSDKQSRTALVIGNQDYEKGRLNNPVRDARAMTNDLTGLGFEVIEILNGNRRKIDNALNCFHEKLKNSGGAGVFYYAGHAVQVSGENYLIPVDADLQVELDVESDTVPLGKVLGKMEGAENNINIIILDSCNDDPFSGGWNRSIETRGLAGTQAVSGSLVAYATKPGRTVNDDGLFTAYILEHINQPNLGVRDMFNQIQLEIARGTQKEQVPFTVSSSVPDFSFNPSPEISVAPAPLPPPTPKPEPTVDQRDRNSRNLITEDFARRSIVSIGASPPLHSAISLDFISISNGVIVAQKGSNYYVLTVKHSLLYDDYLYRVTIYDGQNYQSYDAAVMERFPGLDLALLSFRSNENYPVVPIASAYESLTDIGFNDITLILNNFQEDEDLIDINELAYLDLDLYLDSKFGFDQPPFRLIRANSEKIEEITIGGYSLIYQKKNPTLIQRTGILLNKDGCLVGIHGRNHPDHIHRTDRQIYLGIASDTFLEATRKYTDLDIKPTCNQ